MAVSAFHHLHDLDRHRSTSQSQAATKKRIKPLECVNMPAYSNERVPGPCEADES